MYVKAQAFPRAKEYCFQNDLGFYLDPTDTQGYLSDRPGPGPWWPLAVDVSLSRVNEPPLGRLLRVRGWGGRGRG